MFDRFNFKPKRKPVGLNVISRLHYSSEHLHDNQKTVRFPSVLCSYNNTLEVLKLIYYLLLDFPSRVCFNSLRELHLCDVVFENEESVCNLLSGCSSLEVLVLRRNTSFDVDTYTIAVPSLQRLTIEADSKSHDASAGGYVINAPSLQYLNIKDLSYIDFCLIENAPELVEAKLDDVSNIANENILAALTSAKLLSLDLPEEIKCPTGSIFYQLVSLELRIYWWYLLSFMLVSSPKLQNLKLISPFWRRRDVDPVDWKWNEPSCVPDCLLLHLETFVWEEYEWEREDEKQVATYILKNATRLKKVTFFTSEELEKLEKRGEMLNELASVARSSNSCHLVFESW